MKDCTNCKYAEWELTTAGKLHPEGYGECTFEWSLQPLPASMFWIGGKPAPVRGIISRKKPLSEHCVYFVRK